MVTSQDTATYHADVVETHTYTHMHSLAVLIIYELVIKHCLLRACVKGCWYCKVCANRTSLIAVRERII